MEIVEDSVAALPAAYRLSYLTPRRTSLPAARAVTVNVVGEAVASLSEPQMENYGTALPVVEQMEGAAVAHISFAAGVPCYMFKSISDNAGEESVREYRENMQIALSALQKKMPAIFDEVCNG